MKRLLGQFMTLCHPQFSAWLQGASKGICATVLTKRELLQMPLFAATDAAQALI